MTSVSNYLLPDLDLGFRWLLAGPHILIVQSSETEANIWWCTGFQETQFTVRVWPVRVAIGSSRLMCHTYTLLSVMNNVKYKNCEAPQQASTYKVPILFCTHTCWVYTDIVSPYTHTHTHVQQCSNIWKTVITYSSYKILILLPLPTQTVDIQTSL